MTETILHQGVTLAYIIRRNFNKVGVHFFTPDCSPQQLGYMHHPAGTLIQPHQHNICERTITTTQEVLFIRRGKLRIDFYNKDCEYLESRIVEDGDVILLASGGHGFEVLEELDMIEVKQGPYVGVSDKTRFSAPRPIEFKLR